tara:strand:- start:10810 stop:11124 length:315 start_codon:yes stop_codon:yes gene_type:complete
MMQTSFWGVTVEAIERSYAASPETWREKAREIAIEICYEKEEWTTDDIWEKGLAKVREPRALGGVCTRLRNEGIIEDTGRVRRSTREGNHGRKLTIWRSIIWGT